MIFIIIFIVIKPYYMLKLPKAYYIHNEICETTTSNKGIVTLTFANGKAETVRVISSKFDYNINGSSGEVVTFTDDINKTKTYDLFTIEKVSK
jgi:hypothetical protein